MQSLTRSHCEATSVRGKALQKEKSARQPGDRPGEHANGAAGACSDVPSGVLSPSESFSFENMERAGGTHGRLCMKFSLLLFLAAISVLLSQNVFAADIGPADTIIVTATRTEIPLSDSMVPVTVITRDDIELSLARDLAELLRFEAGIDIARSGGPGQSTSMFLRGTESNHTLVLIDGVRMNPGTLGGAAIQNIASELIERVEIVKGARSALYGTDAIGGVINIITRRTDAGFIEAGLGSGSFESQSGHVSGGNRGDDGEFGVTLNWQSTDGYAPRTDSDIERGYDNFSANLYGTRRIGNSELSIRHWRAEGNVEYLDFFLAPVDQDYENNITAVEIDTRFSDVGDSKLIISYMQDNIQQIQSADFVESNRLSLDWQYSHAFERNTVTGGLFIANENASALSFGSGFDEDTEIRAVFLQDQFAIGRHRAFAAVRLTDYESFGNHTTWNAEYGFEINAAWTINMGLGHAFRAPDATDRFGFGGSIDLRPELADETQIALRYAPGNRHSVSLEIFANDIEDLIDFDFATFTLQNIGEVEIRSVQLSYEYRGESFSIRTDIINQTADDKIANSRLLRRAEHSATINYTQNIGHHRMGLSVLVSGDRMDFGFPENITLDGYVVATLTGQFRLSDSWQLSARIENLFDEEYQTINNYRMQERSGFVELKYRWR